MEKGRASIRLRNRRKNKFEILQTINCTYVLKCKCDVCFEFKKIFNYASLVNKIGKQLSAPFADYLDSIFEFCSFINTSPKKENLNF